jgi:hypothetical protein
MQSQDKTNKGQSKVTRYGWEIVDAPGEFLLIDKRNILVDHKYQRSDLSQQKVLEISSEWSWASFGTIPVAKRPSGFFYAIDGQHRLLAAMKRDDIQFLPCMVFHLENAKEEATAFLSLNANRRPVSAISKHKASTFAGDQLSVVVNTTLSQFGLKLSPTAKNKGEIKCVDTLKRMAKENPEAFPLVLSLCTRISNQDSVCVHEKLLNGIWHLHNNVEGGLNNQRFVHRIEQLGATQLIRGATRAATLYARGGAKVFASGMLEEINKGLKNKFEMRAT